tara:strand:+ start:426 stop:761 length:336 start_codon:yes stop_codon:yes gene_type:complete
MKKIILVPLILISSFAFCQTYKSKQVIKDLKVVKELHEIIIKEKTFSFDGKEFAINNVQQQNGSVSATIYIGKDDSITVMRRNEKVYQISYSSFNKGVSNMIVCLKIKEVK